MKIIESDISVKKNLTNPKKRDLETNLFGYKKKVLTIIYQFAKFIFREYSILLFNEIIETNIRNVGNKVSAIIIYNL